MLEARCRAPSTPQGEVKRARIVLLAAEGRSTRAIAKEVGVQPRIVSKWRHRFADHGLAGLNDQPRATKPPIYGQATNKRILALLDKPPPKGYAPAITKDPRAQLAGVQKAPRVAGGWTLADSERYVDLMMAPISILGRTPARRQSASVVAGEVGRVR